MTAAASTVTTTWGWDCTGGAVDPHRMKMSRPEKRRRKRR
jgi:hypothetical protein